jgi:hypothetical protein
MSLFKKITGSIGGLFKKGGGVHSFFSKSKDNLIDVLERLNLFRDGEPNPLFHINYKDNYNRH